jgi:hypothetical protein
MITLLYWPPRSKKEGRRVSIQLKEPLTYVNTRLAPVELTGVAGTTLIVPYDLDFSTRQHLQAPIGAALKLLCWAPQEEHQIV